LSFSQWVAGVFKRQVYFFFKNLGLIEAFDRGAFKQESPLSLITRPPSVERVPRLGDVDLRLFSLLPSFCGRK